MAGTSFREFAEVQRMPRTILSQKRDAYVLCVYALLYLTFGVYISSMHQVD
jgi:hypothetical protein